MISKIDTPSGIICWADAQEGADCGSIRGYFRLSGTYSTTASFSFLAPRHPCCVNIFFVDGHIADTQANNSSDAYQILKNKFK
jgi:hypothetical protein